MVQNGTNITLESQFGFFRRGDQYTPSITTTKQTTHMKSVEYADRSGRRAKPTIFVPKNGTASSMDVVSWSMLQKGIHGNAGSWQPNSSTHFREFAPFEAENPYTVAERSKLIHLTDLSPLIQNKIREEIMSGKAQLAVDLVELRKTKTMFADAAAGLWHAYRDLRAGRPFNTFVKEMNKYGYRSYAGKKWLEYIYGWAPTVSGAFETAEVLSKNLQQGSVVLGKVRTKLKQSNTSVTGYSVENRYCEVSARGFYQYTIRDAKLLRLSQLGFLNPLSVAWELTPWSFVLDWFVDVGGYISRMDFALGLSDISWQYSCFRKSYNHVIYHKVSSIELDTQPMIVICTTKSHQRNWPSQVISNTFKGLKPFTNETVRLTSAVALINHQLTQITRVR